MRELNLSAKRKSMMKRFSLLSCVIASFAIFSACTNISSSLGRLPSSFVDQSDPNAEGNGGAFQLYSVNPDQANPGASYVMVGQNEEFDTYCGGSLGTCLCEYTFEQPGVGTQTVSSAVTYQESNLLRCPNSVPSGIVSFDARITVVSTGGTAPTPAGGGAISYSSNRITVSLSTNGAFAGSTSYIDLTSAASYVPVQRFQCRKREFIANPLDNKIIDPLQSSDPAVIYAFNYYTTNVSESLLRMQQIADQSWECSLSATKDRTLHWWSNPNVFSSAACTTAFCNGDGYLMYPQNSLSSGKIAVSASSTANGKRRGSFSLSSIPYGVFQVPVKAAVAPLNYVSANYAVIGYAAKPIASTNGSSACPAIPIPAKATWVKLWNFRATDITPPKVVTATQSSTNSAIACDTSHGLNLFPSCEAIQPAPVNSAFGNALSGRTGTELTLASRIALLDSSQGSAATSACYNVDASQWRTGPSTNPLYNGQDIWNPSPFAFDATVPMSTIAGFPYNMYTPAATDPWTFIIGAGPTNYRWFTETGLYSVPAATPQDVQNQITTDTLSADNYTDQLFITTDPSVDDSLMRNSSPSVAHFIPKTYRSMQACPGANPTDPTCANASPLNWGINVKEVGNTTSSDTYPLCVLQFYD